MFLKKLHDNLLRNWVYLPDSQIDYLVGTHILRYLLQLLLRSNTGNHQTGGLRWLYTKKFTHYIIDKTLSIVLLNLYVGIFLVLSKIIYKLRVFWFSFVYFVT